MRGLADTGLPDRPAVVAAVTEAMGRSGRRWAWQGPADAPQRWMHDTGPKDLDLWFDDPAVADGSSTPAADADHPVDVLRRSLRCASIADARHPGRPRHVSLAVETATGVAVVDLSYGDLRVGPILLAPADEIDVDPDAHRLSGAAAVADLLVRPVLRGRWPGPARLAEARAVWGALTPGERQRLTGRLAAQLGTRLVAGITAVLDGAGPDPGLPRRARQRLAVRSLVPANARATWAQRRTVIPAGRAAGPLGLRVRGVVVALVGTDGAGKSTVADGLAERLHGYGVATASAYFGMARGNLPGVRLARRLLGVATPAPGGKAGEAPGGSATGVGGGPGAEVAGEAPRPASRSASRPADHPYLRRAAAWFYAAEYVWRYLRVVAPSRSRRRVVIVDRWVYDLRESPWPGSAAARVAERLVPEPDILVLPDAPAELIHARKPERPLAEQADQQQRYRRLLAERPARYAEVVVDTSGGCADPLGELVATVVEAAHGARRRGRR